jgi:4-hydroxy-tetrahydrodipicolinate synthase
VARAKPENTFTGVFTAISTPFTDDGSQLDLQRLDAMLERQVRAGVAGIVPCGTTGEFQALSHVERRTLVERCAASVGDRLELVPHTGALTTAEAVALSRHAVECGAKGVLAMPPFFAPLTRGELLRYYAEIVESVQVPVILYHNPAVTGLTYGASELVDLCAAVGIRHLKYTSADASGLTQLLLEHATDVQTLPAWDHLTLTAFASGATASIWGAASAVPELCVALLTSTVK